MSLKRYNPVDATHSCNCMYGPQDSRCCIARSQRAALEEAWRLGREGKPLSDEKTPPRLSSWVESVPRDAFALTLKGMGLKDEEEE